MAIAPHCICTTVSEKALQALLESTGRGTFRDAQPWLVARDLLEDSRGLGVRVPILFATGSPAHFSHWGFIETLEVVELHRSSWESACTFTPLKAVHPIFESIDSVFLKPTAEQITRERLEGIPQHRYPVTEAELHPYAIGETPAFIILSSSTKPE